MPWRYDYSESPWMGLPEDFGLDKLLRSLQYILIVWMVLLEVLFLSPEQLEEMKKTLKEESLRERAEHDLLTKYK